MIEFAGFHEVIQIALRGGGPEGGDDPDALMQEVQEPLFLEPLGPGTIGVSNGEELCSGIDGVEE